MTEQNRSNQTPEETVRETIHWYNRHDFEKFNSFFSQDYKRYSLWTGWNEMEMDSYKEMWTQYLIAFPDVHWEIINLYPSDNHVIAEVYETATFTKPWQAAPGKIIQPTGKSYKARYCCVYKVEDGLVSSYTLYEDASLFKQLGIENQAALITEAGMEQ